MTNSFYVHSEDVGILDNVVIGKNEPAAVTATELNYTDSQSNIKNVETEINTLSATQIANKTALQNEIETAKLGLQVKTTAEYSVNLSTHDSALTVTTDVLSISDVSAAVKGTAPVAGKIY